MPNIKGVMQAMATLFAVVPPVAAIFAGTLKKWDTEDSQQQFQTLESLLLSNGQFDTDHFASIELQLTDYFASIDLQLTDLLAAQEKTQRELAELGARLLTTFARTPEATQIFAAPADLPDDEMTTLATKSITIVDREAINQLLFGGLNAAYKDNWDALNTLIRTKTHFDKGKLPAKGSFRNAEQYYEILVDAFWRVNPQDQHEVLAAVMCENGDIRELTDARASHALYWWQRNHPNTGGSGGRGGARALEDALGGWEPASGVARRATHLLNIKDERRLRLCQNELNEGRKDQPCFITMSFTAFIAELLRVDADLHDTIFIHRQLAAIEPYLWVAYADDAKKKKASVLGALSAITSAIHLLFSKNGFGDHRGKSRSVSQTKLISVTRDRLNHKLPEHELTNELFASKLVLLRAQLPLDRYHGPDVSALQRGIQDVVNGKGEIHLALSTLKEHIRLYMDGLQDIIERRRIKQDTVTGHIMNAKVNSFAFNICNALQNLPQNENAGADVALRLWREREFDLGDSKRV